MSYTVKKLAKISGVSVRALHFYDEIGLLKPASYGENGYRYYEQEQLLLLQQILFYRELGFPLNEIQEIISVKDFDKIKALESHKIVLQKETDRTKMLIQTIEKTLLHLKGETVMSDEEIYYGFDKTKVEEFEKGMVETHGTKAKALFEESRRRTKNWNKADYQKLKKEGDDLHAAFTAALKAHLPVTSTEVQSLVNRHFQMIENFYTPTQEIYLGLAQMYVDHPDFRKMFDAFHPKLAEFIAEAMKTYADRKMW